MRGPVCLCCLSAVCVAIKCFALADAPIRSAGVYERALHAWIALNPRQGLKQAASSIFYDTTEEAVTGTPAAAAPVFALPKPSPQEVRQVMLRSGMAPALHALLFPEVPSAATGEVVGLVNASYQTTDSCRYALCMEDGTIVDDDAAWLAGLSEQLREREMLHREIDVSAAAALGQVLNKSYNAVACFRDPWLVMKKSEPVPESLLDTPASFGDGADVRATCRAKFRVDTVSNLVKVALETGKADKGAIFLGVVDELMHPGTGESSGVDEELPPDTTYDDWIRTVRCPVDVLCDLPAGERSASLDACTAWCACCRTGQAGV